MQISLLGCAPEGERLIKGSHHSESAKLKNAIAHRGRHPTEETLAKLSATSKGRKHTEEAKRKISIAHMGTLRPKSPEMRARISATLKGRPKSPETCAKLSAAFKGRSHPGHPHTAETRRRMSEARLGEKGPNWQGGISFEPYCPKFNKDLKRRVRSFFGGQCLMCGKHESTLGENLSVHHVKYRKTACCDGEPVHFAALCRRCHGRTNHDCDRWADILHRVIDEVYGGRSYFTKYEWANPSLSPTSSRSP
jgi:hypothetical protein